MAEELETRREVTNEANYISKIIAAINPDRYAERDEEVGFVDIAGLKKAAKKDFWDAVKNIGKKFNLKPKNAEEHKIVYNSTSETLEPVYFWVLDKMNDLFGGKVEKLIDNFASSPGSGHFSELMGKATHMQEQIMKIMQTNGVLIKSLVNIIYDLKEFEIRLSHYKAANSKNKEEAEAGLLALKQIWMDNVDIKRGRGSINMLVQDLNFVTLRDAFMIAKSVEEVDSMDLNDRVKRILKPRLQEFLKWRELSGMELKKRYGIEKTYLKNQLDSLKMYTRWAKPYLRAALRLEQKSYGREPALVTAFNTVVFELTLLAKSKFKFEDAVYNKKLPEDFRNIKLKRNYYSCILVDIAFRGIPQKVGQHYVFGGRAEVTFRAYSLNQDEIAMLDEKLEESDLNDALKLAEGMTEESLKELQEDINYFLKEEEKREKLESTSSEEDVNPFSALLGFEKKEKTELESEETEKKKIIEVKPDNYMEKMVRDLAEVSARETCFTLFDIYKKAHGMASHPGPDYDIAYQKPELSKFFGI